MARHLALLVTTALFAGCVEPATQLLVFVSSDFPAGELDAFGIRVVGPGEQVHDRGAFPLTGAVPAELPASFGVAPRRGDATRTVRIEIDAIAAGQRLFTTMARTSFVDGEILRLDTFLARRCRHESADCSPDETCTALGCAPIDVPVEDLRRPDEEPAPTTPSADWTVWSPGASDALVAVGESGAAYVALTVGRDGAFELEDATTVLDPEVQAVVLRVDPSGALPWFLALRSPAPGFLTVGAIAARGNAVWIAGSSPGGLAVDRDGETLLEDDGDAGLFILETTTEGEVTAHAIGAPGTMVVIFDEAVSTEGAFVVGGSTTVPGGILDASWSSAGASSGVALALDADLSSARSCLFAEGPAAVYGVAPLDSGFVAAGTEGDAAVARGLDPDCAPLWDADLGPGAVIDTAGPTGGRIGIVGTELTGALALRLLDQETGELLRTEPLTLDGSWSRLHLERDPVGRQVFSGGSDGELVYDGLSSVPEQPLRFAGHLLGTGPDLEGRWVQRLESDGASTILSAALDPATGAVLIAGTGTGPVRLGGEPLGDRAEPSVLIHRFIP